jgi:hypothetical protein
VAVLLLGTAFGYAQPRPADKTPTSVPTNAPTIYEARYEGGLFGTTKKENGALSFDDANERVVFLREGKEMFSIPYDALLMLYPDSKDSVPQSGKVISALPLPGAGLANLMNKSTKYANMTFQDPDIQVNGTASFRFKEKEKLLMFINTLGVKAKMKQRGDAFYKPRSATF